MTADRRGVPLYDDLPMSDVGGRHSWDVPCCKTLGTIGFIGTDIRRAAASSILSGDLVSLNAPLNVVTPPFFGRSPLRREYVIKWDGLMLEDWVDSAASIRMAIRRAARSGAIIEGPKGMFRAAGHAPTAASEPETNKA